MSASPTPLTAVPSGASPGAAPRLRLEFLDGLRGLMALYVVLYHAYQVTTFDDPRIDAPLVWRVGHPAVSVFIVLSGFSLMLPIVRAGGALRGGVRDYFQRRARRILPPYYAALVLSIFFLVAAHLVKYRSGLALHDKVLGMHLSPGSLLSHVFLVHNLSSAWIETIDVPMWSVATEWQIYFFLPFLLLPVWRRFGGWAALAAGFGVGLFPHYLLPPGRNFDWACPWYLGLFAMGMCGAILAFPVHSEPVWRERLPWGRLAAASFLLLVALILFTPNSWIGGYVWQTDALAGAATNCLILHCTARVTKPHPRTALIRALEAPATLWLGAFSYSLYLVHYPILNKMALALDARHLPTGARLAMIYAVGVPLALGLAYLFHLAFEKRFLRPSAAARPPDIVLK